MADARLRILSIVLAASTLAVASVPAFAQFVAPPPAPPILPPNFNQQRQFQNTARPVGSHCSTQVGVCVLNAPGQLGYQCQCTTPRGPILGRIVN
jgi:hypothetical protein